MLTWHRRAFLCAMPLAGSQLATIRLVPPPLLCRVPQHAAARLPCQTGLPHKRNQIHLRTLPHMHAPHSEAHMHAHRHMRMHAHTC